MHDQITDPESSEASEHKLQPTTQKIQVTEEIRSTPQELQVTEEFQRVSEEVQTTGKLQATQEELQTTTKQTVTDLKAESPDDIQHKEVYHERPVTEPEITTDNLTETEEAKQNNKPNLSETTYDKEEDILQEDEKNDSQLRLVDSFLKGKSINDLITDHHKLEFKLSNLPIDKIEKAIGVNDRFQFIRELFDNDAALFVDTIRNIDSMQNIEEAINFIRNTFKWQKTETSLKFLNLIKRRFSED